MNIFEKAAQILAEGGHCKHLLSTPEGKHCANGALWAAVGDGKAWEDLDWEARRVAVEAGQRAGDLLYERRMTYAHGIPGMVNWNNADETTGEDVILLFKELAHDEG